MRNIFAGALASPWLRIPLEIVFGILLPAVSITLLLPKLPTLYFSGLGSFRASVWATDILVWICLVIWIAAQSRLPGLVAALFSGVLIAGGALSILLSLGLFWSLYIGGTSFSGIAWMSVFLLIGGFIYLVEGLGAFEPSRTRSRRVIAVLLALLGFILLIAIPEGIRHGVKAEVGRCVRQIADGSNIDGATRTLKLLRPFADLQPLIDQYDSTNDAAVRSRLETASEKITGSPISEPEAIEGSDQQPAPTGLF